MTEVQAITIMKRLKPICRHDEDLMQDALLITLEAEQRGVVRNIEAFAIGSARKHAANVRRLARNAMYHSDEPLGALQSPEPTPEDALLAVEQQDADVRALGQASRMVGKMPAPERAVWRRIIAGQALVAIAGELGKSYRSVACARHRGMLVLRARLRKEI